MRIKTLLSILMLISNTAFASCVTPKEPSWFKEPYVGSVCDDHQDKRNYSKKKCDAQQKEYNKYSAELDKYVVCMSKPRKKS